MKLRVLLVDDEPPARARIRRLLADAPDVEIVGEAGDGADAVRLARELAPDLLLLDIAMPGLDGFGVLAALGPERTPHVIFLTGYDRHAVRAFEARALDYLLKPTSKDRLDEALVRARERLRADRALAGEAGATAAEAAPAARLAVRGEGGTEFVPVDRIDRVEAAGNYVILHVGERTHILRDTMSAMEAKLPAETFMRVSRAAIVNLARVRGIRTGDEGEHLLTLESGAAIPFTRGVREIEARLKRL